MWISDIPFRQWSGWSQYATIYSEDYLQRAVQATDADTQATVCQNSLMFLVNKAVLLTPFSTQPIKTLVSFLTLKTQNKLATSTLSHST